MDIILQYYAKTTIPGLNGFVLDIPDPSGIFGGGLLAGVGLIMQILFGFSIVLWVFLTAMYTREIIGSEGNADKIKEAVNKNKYIWIAVSALPIFFVALSLAGTSLGFGNVGEWGNTLAQCGGYAGPFYFAQVDQQRDYYASSRANVQVPAENKAFCCAFDSKKAVDWPFEQDTLSFVGIKPEDKYAWILFPYVDPTWNTDTFPGQFDGYGISDCHKFGE